MKTDRSDDVNRLKTMMLNHGAAWVAETMASLCEEYSRDLVSETPLYRAWLRRHAVYQASAVRLREIKRLT
jgi:hypothetical protein